MAARKNLAARQGNTMRAEFRLKDGDGAAIDLTGSDIRVVIKGGAVTIRKSTVANTLEMVAPAGIVRLVLTPAESRSLPIGAPFARYELERAIAGEEITLLEGDIVVTLGLNDDG